jgi:hypothetical protein
VGSGKTDLSAGSGRRTWCRWRRLLGPDDRNFCGFRAETWNTRVSAPQFEMTLISRDRNNFELVSRLRVCLIADPTPGCHFPFRHATLRVPTVARVDQDFCLPHRRFRKYSQVWLQPFKVCPLRFPLITGLSNFFTIQSISLQTPQNSAIHSYSVILFSGADSPPAA